LYNWHMTAVGNQFVALEISNILNTGGSERPFTGKLKEHKINISINGRVQEENR
jgi:hypothetical protein